MAFETILGVLSIGAGVMGAVGQIQSANAQADAAEQNAEIQRRNAATALASSEADAARTEDRTRRGIATAINNTAGNGIDVTLGTPLDLMSDMAAEGALDAQITRWKGRSGAAGNQMQAAASEASADQMRTAGLFGAGGTLLTSGARYVGTRYQSGKAGY